jgi:hypothetical protein
MSALPEIKAQFLDYLNHHGWEAQAKRLTNPTRLDATQRRYLHTLYERLRIAVFQEQGRYVGKKYTGRETCAACWRNMFQILSRELYHANP